MQQPRESVAAAGWRTPLAVTLSIVLALFTASTAVPVWAVDPPAARPTPWNASTTPAPAPLPTTDSTLSLRVYKDTGSGSPLPYRPTPHRRDDPAYAVDVTAVMTRCADDSLIITALVIGGQTTPLPNRCRTESGASGAAPAPPCNANRWNCGTTATH